MEKQCLLVWSQVGLYGIRSTCKMGLINVMTVWIIAFELFMYVHSNKPYNSRLTWLSLHFVFQTSVAGIPPYFWHKQLGVYLAYSITLPWFLPWLLQRQLLTNLAINGAPHCMCIYNMSMWVCLKIEEPQICWLTIMFRIKLCSLRVYFRTTII